MIPEIEIDDDFYVLYSFVHDFGYTKQDEIQSIIELLDENGIETNTENVKKALEYIRDILLVINEEYSEDIAQYIKSRVDQKIISGDLPFPLSVAKKIFSAILSTGESILTALRGKDEDEKMVDKIIGNFEQDHEDIVIKITKTYQITKTKKSDPPPKGVA